MCKGPVAGMCLTCSKKVREANVTKWSGRGRKRGEEVSKMVREWWQMAFWSRRKASDFMLSNSGATGGF